MTVQELSEYCLSKYGAYSDLPFGPEPTCFRIRKRIFAQLYPRPDFFRLTLKCEPMQGDFFRRSYPDAITKGYFCPASQQPYWYSVWIDKIAPDVLLGMIDQAYDAAIKELPQYVQKQLREEAHVVQPSI